MKKCIKCGAQLQDAVRFCPVCGAEQGSVAGSARQVGNALPPQPDDPFAAPVPPSAKEPERPQNAPSYAALPYTAPAQGQEGASPYILHAQGQEGASPYIPHAPYGQAGAPYGQPVGGGQEGAPLPPSQQTYVVRQQQAPEKKANGAGIAGFVFGMLALILVIVGTYESFMATFGVGLIGLICSSVGAGRYGTRTVSGFAVAGLILNLGVILYWFGELSPLFELLGLGS